jgi:hypothetical protein
MNHYVVAFPSTWVSCTAYQATTEVEHQYMTTRKKSMTAARPLENLLGSIDRRSHYVI